MTKQPEAILSPASHTLGHMISKQTVARFAIAIAIGLSLGGCLPIPHRHTTQAGAHFHVIDGAGHPLAGVTVNVYQGSIIGGRLRRLRSDETDSQGDVAFPRRRKWHYLLVLIPDAEAPSVFGWCAESNGFTTVGGQLHDAADQRIAVVMGSGASATDCPPVLDRYRLERSEVVAPSR